MSGWASTGWKRASRRLGRRDAALWAGQVGPQSHFPPLETGLRADTRVSHSFYQPPKAYLSSEPLDEAVHRYLTVVKYETKQNKNTPREPNQNQLWGGEAKNSVSVQKARQKHLLIVLFTLLNSKLSCQWSHITWLQCLSYDSPAMGEMGILFSRILDSVVDESESEF